MATISHDKTEFKALGLGLAIPKVEKPWLGIDRSFDKSI